MSEWYRSHFGILPTPLPHSELRGGIIRSIRSEHEIKRPEEVDAEQGKRGDPEDTSLPESDQSEETARDE